MKSVIRRVREWRQQLELTRISVAKFFDSGGLLLLTDLLVLLLVGGSLQTLPGKTAAQEVHENMTEGLEIITP